MRKLQKRNNKIQFSLVYNKNHRNSKHQNMTEAEEIKELQDEMQVGPEKYSIE